MIGEGLSVAADFVLLCDCLDEFFLEPFFLIPPSVAGLRTSGTFDEGPKSTFSFGTERVPTVPFEKVRGLSSTTGLGCRDVFGFGTKGFVAEGVSACFDGPLRLPDRGLDSGRPGPGPPSSRPPLPRPRPRPRELPRGVAEPLTPPVLGSLRLQDRTSASFVLSFDIYSSVRR